MPRSGCMIRIATLLVIVHRSIGLVRLATWNLLAPDYAREDKYPWCQPEHLDWNHRQSLIVPRILALEADLICLQEVQVDSWPGLLSLLAPKYDGVLQNVTSGHNVASAMLIRKDSSLSIERVESRSRILLAVLRDKGCPHKDSKIYVGSVHLEAGCDGMHDMTRFYQIKSLFKRLNRQCEVDGIETNEATVILAGDFNMLRSNLMHKCLSEGLLYHPQDMKNKPPIEILKMIDALSGAISEEEKGLQMTFAKGGVLDYIWVTPQVEVGKAIFPSEAFKRDPQQWPSHDQPSDHLPIGVELQLVR